MHRTLEHRGSIPEIRFVIFSVIVSMPYRNYILLGKMTPIQIFELFVDNEVIDWIVSCSVGYANIDNNDATFTTDAKEMRKFIGISFVSG